MRTLGFVETDLAPGTTIVTSGLVWLTRRQHQSWAYLRLRVDLTSASVHLFAAWRVPTQQSALIGAGTC
jgi:hypothetical protein